MTHLFICPRLLWQEEWRRRFEKEMDFWFMLNPGLAWPHANFEPLLVGISFPVTTNMPWLVRQLREQVVEASRTLSQVSKTCHIRVRDYLRKLWPHPREVLSMPGGRGVLIALSHTIWIALKQRYRGISTEQHFGRLMR